MYEKFYGLKEKPFSIQPDPDFLYFSKRHRLAYSMLEYGIENRAGFTVITGDIGCGKTTLIRHLLNHLPMNARVGLISNMSRDIDDPLEWVMMSFDQPYQNMSRAALFDAFQQFLIKEYAQARRAVLIIDEAQNLNVKALESLRMLSNINADKDQLLQIVLVGQPELKATLQRPELKQFAQRVSVDFHLPALNRSEVGLYVLHRLKVGGRSKPLFTHEAIMRIGEVSGGVPRSINILCDLTLVYGFSNSLQRIDQDMVEEVYRDKQKFGIFQAPFPAHKEIEEAQPGQRKPALVIYDQKLAQEILVKLKAEKAKS